MSLRRSARARVPASDPDAVVAAPTSGERQRKRTRSSLTPEASQSPGKAASPGEEGSHADAGASTSSPLTGRPSARKIVVRNMRTGAKSHPPEGEQGEPAAPLPSSEQHPPPSPAVVPNGTTSLLDLKTEDDVEEEREELRELYIGREEKKKLETVLRVYAGDLMIQKVEQASRKHGRSFQSLEQMIAQPKCDIRAIRNQILALRAPLTSPSALRAHMSSSHISPPKEEVDRDRKRLSTLTMMLAIVDEIAAREMEKAGKVDLLDRPAKANRAEEEYALSMRLPNGDYFTNAVRLPTKEAQQLDTGYSKLVSIVATPSSQPPPTLGERLDRKGKNKRSAGAEAQPEGTGEDDVAKPVSHLYYGPWSSFAPTYDSFDGNLNMQASCALWRSKEEDQRALKAMMIEPPSERQQLQETLSSLKDVDANVVLREYDELSRTASLETSADLINKLDEMQSQRWKRTFAKRMLDKADGLTGRSVREKDFDGPSQEEREVAAEILDTLSTILTTHSGSLADLIPVPSVLQAASQSACIDPALMDGKGEPGYWGTLNDSLYGPDATRRVPGARSVAVKPPSAIRDNETIRMEPANEEKVSAAMTQPTATTKGKGLLERFAMGRNYKVEDHPHDRKLAVPTPSSPNQVRPGMQQSQTSYRSAMSPPNATPPARPYHAQMRPAPAAPASSTYMMQQQAPASGKLASYGSQYRPPPAQSPRSWPSQQAPGPINNTASYLASPYQVGRPPTAAHNQRFLSGSPS